MYVPLGSTALLENPLGKVASHSDREKPFNDKFPL